MKRKYNLGVGLETRTAQERVVAGNQYSFVGSVCPSTGVVGMLLRKDKQLTHSVHAKKVESERNFV